MRHTAHTSGGASPSSARRDVELLLADDVVPLPLVFARRGSYELQACRLLLLLRGRHVVARHAARLHAAVAHALVHLGRVHLQVANALRATARADDGRRRACQEAGQLLDQVRVLLALGHVRAEEVEQHDVLVRVLLVVGGGDAHGVGPRDQLRHRHRVDVRDRLQQALCVHALPNARWAPNVLAALRRQMLDAADGPLLGISHGEEHAGEALLLVRLDRVLDVPREGTVRDEVRRVEVLGAVASPLRALEVVHGAEAERGEDAIDEARARRAGRHVQDRAALRRGGPPLLEGL
mmetsp:Transcript_50991/g.122541  ORF Transcript_50991/g.122541 Transcript_50991/m.122541 type:complete len:294 (+) Transcript_50991:83-964(+)